MKIIEQANNHVVHVLVGIVAHARTLENGIEHHGPGFPAGPKARHFARGKLFHFTVVS